MCSMIGTSKDLRGGDSDENVNVTKEIKTDGANQLELPAEDMKIRWQIDCMYLLVIMKVVEQPRYLDPYEKPVRQDIEFTNS